MVPPHGSQVAESASDQAVVTSTSLGPELSVSPIIAPTGTDNKPQASSTPLVAVPGEIALVQVALFLNTYFVCCLVYSV